MTAINQNKAILSKHEKTIAIIQMTRLGDLIQTCQAVSSLKKTHPQYKLVLIGRSQFVKPLMFLLNNYFDEIISLDTKKIFSLDSVAEIQSELQNELDKLNRLDIDVLINLSFSKSSNYLMSNISSRHKIGSYFDINNKIVINDKWSQLLFSTVMRGSLNPYGLVDLFKKIIGVKENAGSGTIKNNSGKKENLITIHPFASRERKSWRVEKWVEIIYKQLKDQPELTITVVGAKNEILKSNLICENPLLKPYTSRLINVVGKTTIEDLAQIVQSSKAFIGHDSMVGHLASIYQTPTITISLGNVRPHETTPYQNNAYNLAPRTKCFPCFPTDNCQYYQCHHDIPYQVVNSAITELLNHGEISAKNINNTNSAFHLNSVSIYRSVMKNDQMQLVSLSQHTGETSEIFRSLYRITWSFIINNVEENVPFPKLSNQSHKELLESLTGLQHLFELSEFGQKYSRYILEEISSQTPSLTKIKDFSRKIDEIDSLQSIVKKTAPHLAPIIDYFTVRKANLFGDNIVSLTESSYHVFEESAQVCSIMYELIQNTIAEHKVTQNKTSRNDILK